ncbi:hypothetical protein ABW19_dt0200426 [Dactylella cylindrospora]|nr:hypothetical protein ABW19_dt0200426 [Dactylella cylindrospora]
MRMHQSSSHSGNPSFISLIRLLNRLEQKLPQDFSENVPTSRPSAFEMAKLKALEAESEALKNPSQRQRAVAELQLQKNAAKRLEESLKALEILEDKTIIHVAEEPPAVDEVEAETPGPIITSALPLATLVPDVAPAPAPTSTAAPSNEVTTVLRNRFGKSDSSEEKKPELSVDDALSQQRHEQDDLSDSLLKMAQQLRLNSQMFGDSLENEKAYLDAAVTGLDKNATGIEGAGLRMLQLKQGQNVTWMYQLKVYAALIGLALTAVIIFWLPKLRWGSFF